MRSFLSSSQQIREENAFIRAEGLKAWKVENEARIAEQGKIEDLYFEILIAATRFNNVIQNTLYGYIYTDFTTLFSEIGKIIRSKKHEREADYLGMYIFAAAGGDVSNILNFWRRMAIEELRTMGTLSEGATHPSDSERSILMLATFKEIQEKEKKGMKVLPTVEK